jgi:hypothetical protein
LATVSSLQQHLGPGLARPAVAAAPAPTAKGAAGAAGEAGALAYGPLLQHFEGVQDRHGRAKAEHLAAKSLKAKPDDGL